MRLCLASHSPDARCGSAVKLVKMPVLSALTQNEANAAKRRSKGPTKRTKVQQINHLDACVSVALVLDFLAESKDEPEELWRFCDECCKEFDSSMSYNRHCCGTEEGTDGPWYEPGSKMHLRNLESGVRAAAVVTEEKERAAKWDRQDQELIDHLRRVGCTCRGLVEAAREAWLKWVASEWPGLHQAVVYQDRQGKRSELPFIALLSCTLPKAVKLKSNYENNERSAY